MTTDYTKKALDIIQKSPSEWLKQRDVINAEAIRAGYCCSCDWGCDDDHCRCRAWLVEQERNKSVNSIMREIINKL